MMPDPLRIIQLLKNDKTTEVVNITYFAADFQYGCPC